MAKSNRRWLRLIIAFALMTCWVGCDQGTKHIATETLRGKPAQSYLLNTVRLEYALNPGGFLSLGENLAPQLRFWVFAVFNVLILLATVAVLAAGWNMHLFKFVAFVLILAGGVGNLIDRVLNDGLVTDFANFGIGPVRTGIFNVADVALTTGALVLLITYRGKQADRSYRHSVR